MRNLDTGEHKFTYPDKCILATLTILYLLIRTYTYIRVCNTCVFISVLDAHLSSKQLNKDLCQRERCKQL